MIKLAEVCLTEGNRGIAIFDVKIAYLPLTEITVEHEVIVDRDGRVCDMGTNKVVIKDQKGEHVFVKDSSSNRLKGVGRGRKANYVYDTLDTALNMVDTEMLLGSFDSEIFESFYPMEEVKEITSNTETTNTTTTETEEVTTVTETTNTNKLGKEVDSMKIESINTVYYKKNTAIVTFTKGDVVAKFEVERLGDSGMLTFSLKTAKYGEYEYEQKKGYHSKIKGVGRGRKPQNITQIVQESVEGFAMAMDNKNSNEYTQIMEVFSNTDKIDKLEEKILTANSLDKSISILYNALVELRNDDLMENVFSLTELKFMLECQGLTQDEISQTLNPLTENANTSYFIDVEGCCFRPITKTDLLDIIQKLHSNS